MSRPEVTIPNHKEVNTFYGLYRPKKAAAWAINIALGIGLAPRVSFDEGVENRIEQLFEEKRNIMMSSKHHRRIDPFVLAAGAIRNRALRPFVAHSFIFSKAPNSEKPLQRYVLDILGQMPAFRKEDVDPEFHELIPAANFGLIKAARKRKDDGLLPVLFGEGGTIEDTHQVADLQKGVGMIACYKPTTEDKQSAILPIGLYYVPYETGNSIEKLHSLRHPYMHVGTALEGPFTNADDVLVQLRPAMQSAQDTAIKLAEAA